MNSGEKSTGQMKTYAQGFYDKNEAVERKGGGGGLYKEKSMATITEWSFGGSKAKFSETTNNY